MRGNMHDAIQKEYKANADPSTIKIGGQAPSGSLLRGWGSPTHKIVIFNVKSGIFDLNHENNKF